MTTIAYIGLGSNLGPRTRTIRAALARLKRLDGVRLLRCSTLHETDPIGMTDQPKFINAVAEVATDLEPAALLRGLRRIEAVLGRVRRTKWGPRTIDLDLLLWGERIVDRPTLVIPHPRMTERRFVLEPLAELCPERIVPGTGFTVHQLLHAVGRKRA